MLWQTQKTHRLGLDVSLFKFAKSIQCCVVRPHAAVLDLAHSLSANANDAAQMQLRQASLPA